MALRVKDWIVGNIGDDIPFKSKDFIVSSEHLLFIWRQHEIQKNNRVFLVYSSMHDSGAKSPVSTD